MATLPFDLPANLKSIQPYLELAADYESMDPGISYWCRLFALKQGFILKRVEEDLSFLLYLMEILGKNKQELQSKIEATDIPVARAHLEGVIQKLLNWAESAPSLVLFTNVVTKAYHSAGMLQDVCLIFGEPSEEQVEKKMYTGLNKQSGTSESTTKKSNIQHQDVGNLSGNLVCEISGELRKDGPKKKNGSPLTSTTTNGGGNATKENDEKKVYGRLFLLKLRNHPVSQKRPENLPTLEIVRNRMKRFEINADELLGAQEQQPMSEIKGNPGHTGSMQGRPTQGNNQFFGRQIRPGNQHMPRPAMAGGTINPNHPPNAPQALPYPGLKQPVLFVIGDQFNQQQPVRMPSLVWQAFQQPRAAQQSYAYRQTPPYPSFPMQSTPAIYYQPQQPQPLQPQQQQQQQPQQTQQPQQPQQVPVAPPPTAQPRESSGASRRARSSGLRLVDPNTNRDILTGEEVPPSAVVTPTTATPPEIVATGVVTPSTATL